MKPASTNQIAAYVCTSEERSNVYDWLMANPGWHTAREISEGMGKPKGFAGPKTPYSQKNEAPEASEPTGASGVAEPCKNQDVI